LTPSDASRSATGSQRLVLLISTVLFINYVDRGNLATAAPLIQDQLHLSATQLGTLLSAFFYSYVVMMTPVGWLAERFGAHRVLAVGVAIWSAATFLTGFAGGFVSLLLLRLMLGVGESTGFPCSSKLVPGTISTSMVLASTSYTFPLLALLASALMAGFFYAHSFSVMPGLAASDPLAPAHALGGIKAVIRTTVFAFGFFGALAFPVGAALLARRRPVAVLALASALVRRDGLDLVVGASLCAKPPSER